MPENKQSSFAQTTGLTTHALEKKFGVLLSHGLTSREAEARLAREGRNELIQEPLSWLHVLSRQLKSPFFYLLAISAASAFFLGELTNGILILLFVCINAGLGFYQEYKSERTAQLLKTYLANHARVLRDGRERVIPAPELVPGDVVVLEEGDLVPADVRFTTSSHLLINESVLTGESAPVTKDAAPLVAARRGGRGAQGTNNLFHARNIGFSGTLIEDGKATGIVIATGAHAELGAITSKAAHVDHPSAFEQQIGNFSKFILRLVIVTLFMVFVVNVVIKRDSADIPTLVLFSLTLAVSVIPEALPVVSIFSLSRGALQLAKQKVVVKRLTAIEDLGSIDVLCSDKTGTLTENKLRVSSTYPASHPEILVLAAIASAHHRDHAHKEPNNSFDIALWDALTPEGQQQVGRFIRAEELPFDPAKRYNALFAVNKHAGERVAIVRGAYQEVSALCTHLTARERARATAWEREQGMQGNRVIAIAAAKPASRTRKVGLARLIDQKEFEFIGMIALTDPIKATAARTVVEAKKLGLTIKILTGDAPEVAGYVGHTIGLIAAPTDVITGDQFDHIPNARKHEVSESYSVFARFSPDQKYELIQLLQEKHQVGFIGEGINDAPALKLAHVAIAVQGASDIAREASDLLLLKKDLSVIVNGIRQGRQIFANTIKYIKATLASNFGNFYAVALASLFVPFLPMLPIQILLVNLLSDFPMIAVATDTVDEEELRRPKTYNIKSIALLTTLLGIVSTFFDFLLFGLFRNSGASTLQTNWFMASILTELLFMFSIRTRKFFLNAKRPSGTLMGLAGLAGTVTLALPFIPLTRQLFSFQTPSVASLVVVIGISAAYLSTSELVKLLYYRFTPRTSVIPTPARAH